MSSKTMKLPCEQILEHCKHPIFILSRFTLQLKLASRINIFTNPQQHNMVSFLYALSNSSRLLTCDATSFDLPFWCKWPYLCKIINFFLLSNSAPFPKLVHLYSLMLLLIHSCMKIFKLGIEWKKISDPWNFLLVPSFLFWCPCLDVDHSSNFHNPCQLCETSNPSLHNA